MSDLKVECPHCCQRIAVPSEMLGQTAACPTCQGLMSLPQPVAQVLPAVVVEQTPLVKTSHLKHVPTPKGLIAITWGLCVCTAIPLVGILFSAGMLVCAIMLFRSKNKTGRMNGIVALTLWTLTFVIGFVMAIGAAGTKSDFNPADVLPAKPVNNSGFPGTPINENEFSEPVISAKPASTSEKTFDPDKYLADKQVEQMAEFPGTPVTDKQSDVIAVPALSTSSVIESKIDGDFEGWEGETIVKLMNGQIWQQIRYHYEYHYAYMPDVLIYKSGVRWKMKVEGVREAVEVERLK